MSGAYKGREDWRDMLTRVVAALGGLIVHSERPLKIGEVITLDMKSPVTIKMKCDQRCVVVGEATASQFDRQAKVMLRPHADEFEVEASSEQLYYYFVETD